MNLQLLGKKALVTASTNGIGKQIAKQLAQEGATVLINGRSAASADKVIAEFKESGITNVSALIGDVSTADGISNIITGVDAIDGIDILVNNAGIYFNHDWFSSTPDDWMKLYAMNVIPGISLVQAFVPKMKENEWGRIINISSTEATQPFAFMPDYAATKAAVANITVSLSKALTKTGITVNAISPGLVSTDGLKKFYQEVAMTNGWGTEWPGIEQKIMETVLDNTIGRLGTPEDIANLVCFVASPLSANINGANLRTDGGSTVTVN